jgi:ankyrin repeat protein
MNNKVLKYIIMAAFAAFSSIFIGCDQPASEAKTATPQTAPVASAPSKAEKPTISTNNSNPAGNSTTLGKEIPKKIVPLSPDELKKLNDSIKKNGLSQKSDIKKPTLADASAPDASAALLEQVVIATPAELYLGEFSTSETGSGSVSLKNTSDKPITLLQAKASCGCTTSDFKSGTVLQPGESTEITVTMNGKGRARKMSKTVTFSIDGYPSLRLPVTATTISYITLDSEPIVINEETGTTILTLKSLDDQPFKVTSILPAIAELPAEASSSIELVLDWDMFWDVVQTTKVTIRTDHPLCKDITTNIRLSAEQRQRLNEIISIRRAGGELISKDPTQPLTGDQLARYIKGGRGTKVIEFIKSGKGKYNAVNKEGVSLLSVAAESGDEETVRELLALGAQIERVDRVNRTPLMHAARSKDPSTVLLLLDSGADIQARDRLGGTALSWAAGFGSPEGVQALIDAGADANTVDTILGYTPLHWASGFGDAKSVAILLEADAVHHLVDTAEKRSPLMHAVRTGKEESVKLLLEAGANVKEIDKNRFTALHIAADSNNVSLEKIILLVEAGADVNAKNASGATALDLAKSRSGDGAEEIVVYLQEQSK